MLVYIFTDLDAHSSSGKRSPLGLHRLHGRNPSSNACSASLKMQTFSFFGFLDLQEGRQKMPVDLRRK